MIRVHESDTELEQELERGVVDSLYGASAPILIGVVNCTVAFVLCYLATRDVAFIGFSAAFWLSGMWRYIVHRRYTAAKTKQMTAVQLETWKSRCIRSGTSAAIVLGAWCYYSLAATDNSFAQLTSVTVTIACTVGIAARNFGSSRYVAYQMIAVAAPLVMGLLLDGDYLQWGLAALYGTYFIAIAGMAKALKSVLHTAIHKEAQVSRIANDLRTALQAIPNGLMMFDDSDRLKICCDDAADMLHLPKKLQKSRCSAGDIFRHMRKQFNLSRAQSKSIEADYLAIKEKPNSQLKNFLIHDPGGRVLKFLMQTDDNANLVTRIDDVTQEHASHQKIKSLARTDTLTGLANRSWFLEKARKIKRSLDNHETVLIAAVDLDGFKGINDAYGHPLGDRLLQHVAKCLRSACRAEDMVARFGGDEFMLLMVLEQNNEEQLNNIARRLQSSINGEFHDGDLEIKIGGSVGVAVQSQPEETLEDLILKADTALYEAKRRGNHRVCVHSAEMEEKQKRQMMLTSGLKRAVEEGSLSTAFQPIICSATGAVIDFEALCRWTHDTLGFISPGEFIPIAEENGLVSDITRWQLMAACQTCATLPVDIGVSVNLSAIDLRNNRILDHIDQALENSRIASQRLTVEVTETSLLDLNPPTIELLEQIRKRNIKIALDDFGVGYSSLNYLHKLPIDRLKIDRTFVAQIEDNAKALKLLSIIGQLATALKLQIVIEGVETKSQLNLIKHEIEAPLIQGYYFSAPLPEDKILEFCQPQLQKESLEKRSA